MTREAKLNRIKKTHRILGILIGVIASLSVAVPLASAAVSDYGKNDSGGFRNILPPGSAGVFGGNLFNVGPLPAHFWDQQSLYEDLVYGTPGLTDGQIANYYKDATFGVRPADIESSVKPRAGVTILREKDFGVPKIYGTTRANTMFGAGYAGAADRLFLMDVLRHTGRAELSPFLGGANLGSDSSQWNFAPYTEADLKKQITQFPKQYGKAGRQAVSDLNSYVAGINAYIADAKAGRRGAVMPIEYSVLWLPETRTVERWKPTDVIATASLIGGIFGAGGGGEVASAQAYNDLVDALGAVEAKAVWADFRAKNDPEAPTTVSKRFPYQTGDPFQGKGLALPDQGTVERYQTATTPARAPRSAAPDFGTGLRASIGGVGHASNWELIPGRRSTTGHPIAVMGPQVGYYIPQVLMEEELHGPGIDTRGAAFAGINLVVQLGRGRDYAWSATSASADLTDTFAEQLCGGSQTKYLYKGKCRNMEVLTKQISWAPNNLDSTSAGTRNLTALRTVHGIVTHYADVGGKPVAYVTARTTYGHEADSVVGFSMLNSPNSVKSAASFEKAVQKINFTFNWAYVDANDTAYYLSGLYPQRATGVSGDFPVWGTGRYDWKSFNPANRTMAQIPPAQHPKGRNPDVLVSWNNKYAPGFSSADDNWSYTSNHRSNMISDKLQPEVDSEISPSDLVKAMSNAATQDLRCLEIVPLLNTAFDQTGGQLNESNGISDGIADSDAVTANNIMDTLNAWYDDGCHRRDLDENGTYENEQAVALMDATFKAMVGEAFEPTLTANGLAAVKSVAGGFDDTGGSPHAPSFSGAWTGIFSKDLRSVFNIGTVQGPYSHEYCGSGNVDSCRVAIANALAYTGRSDVLNSGFAGLYNGGTACDSDPAPDCFDRNRSRVTSAAPTFYGPNQSDPADRLVYTSFPFQNRPTFQQVITTTKKLRR